MVISNLTQRVKTDAVPYSEVGLGEVLDTALAVQGSSVQGAAAVKVDAAAARLYWASNRIITLW